MSKVLTAQEANQLSKQLGKKFVAGQMLNDGQLALMPEWLRQRAAYNPPVAKSTKGGFGNGANPFRGKPVPIGRQRW